MLDTVQDNGIWKIGYQVVTEERIEYVRIWKLQGADTSSEWEKKERLRQKCKEKYQLDHRRNVGENKVADDKRTFLGIRSWRRAAADKREWYQKIKKAKHNLGCSAKEEDEGDNR